MNTPRNDLLRAPTGETVLMDQYKSFAFLQQNPTWAIVGVNLSQETTKTPFGDIGAVIE
jgi:hypothetical protein